MAIVGKAASSWTNILISDPTQVASYLFSTGLKIQTNFIGNPSVLKLALFSS